MSTAAEPVNPGLIEAAEELITSLDVAIVLLHGVRPDGSCSCAKVGCASPGKHPRDTGWKQQATKDIIKVREWTKLHTYLNLGWIPGDKYLVVDVDPRNGGVDSYQRLRHMFPVTRSHVTGGAPVNGQRGRHGIYRRPPGVKLNQTGRIAQGIDYKTGNGSLLVAPGSRTQGPYLVLHAEAGVVDAPSDIIRTITGGQSGGTTATGPGPRSRFEEPILVGDRDEELTRYAGDLAGRVNRGSLTLPEARKLMAERWQQAETNLTGDNVSLDRAQSMLDRMLAKDTIRDVSPDEPVEDPTLPDGFWANDIGNSQRLMEHIRGQAKWVDSWSSWVVYSNGVWRIDANRVRMLEHAQAAVIQMRQAAALLPKKPREALWKWANASSAAKNLENMVKMARGADDIFINHDQLNGHPHLLNVLNGTIDLTTNDILPHAPGHLLTAQAPVEYDPDAKCPTWDACVKRWLPDPEVRWFVQKAAGSGLIGHAVQHLFINYGDGGNGKGTFYNTIGMLLGDDYYTVPHQGLITVQKHMQHDTVKASLYGARMAVAGETAESARLNEAQVKELTGGDILRARRMRENEWSFRPTYTMFMHTNHKPTIQGNDEGIWRRVFLIPWTVIIPEAERDDQFKERLITERSGILNWLLQGCAGFLLEGFKDPPEAVVVATQGYRAENDLLGRFLTERGIVADPAGYEKSSDLQYQYQSWVTGQGIKMPPTWKAVAERLYQMGALDYRTKGSRGYKGVRINTGVNADKHGDDAG